jgi:hypothetical protein
VSWFRYPVIFTFVTLESPVGFFFFLLNHCLGCLK